MLLNCLFTDAVSGSRVTLQLVCVCVCVCLMTTSRDNNSIDAVTREYLVRNISNTQREQHRIL